MEKIFKLDSWIIFAVTIVPVLFSGYLGFILELWYGIFFAVWFYQLVIALYERLPEGHGLDIKKFKFYFYFPVVYFLLVLFITGGVGYSINLNNMDAYGGMAIFILPLHLFAMFCIFYCMYFVSKALISVDTQKPDLITSDYIGYIFGFWIFPIGVWFIQPIIQRIFNNNKIKITPLTEPEIEPEETGEPDPYITYTKHSYKSDKGELVIEQELHLPNVGEKAYLNGIPAPTGKYKIGFLQTVIIVDGEVAKELPNQTEEEKREKTEPQEERKPVFTKHTYKCPEGELVIEQEYHMPNYGESVYLNGKPAPTGRYEIGLFKSIFVADGKVAKE